ncbi:MAG: glycosyltransferase family 4 protein [bacterium]
MVPLRRHTEQVEDHAGGSIHVTQFQRRALPGQFSIERLFEDVRAALPGEVQVALRINRHPSRGIVGRVADAISARRCRGTINHVLGDVHYLTWFLPRCGTILTVHDCVSLERMTGLRLRLFWLLWYWWPLRRADHVTVISEYTRSALLEWVRYPAERIHVIPPPLSAEFEAARAPARGPRLRLLQVGTGGNKNLARVIEAVQDLPVDLVIIGKLSAALRSELERRAISFESYFDLSRAELLDQYRRADALVFVSTYEGFGLPIIEAQAIGRPVVTSLVCSMPEAAGGGACLVDPTDVADIRRGIRRLIEDPAYCASLVERGYANAAKYSAAGVAEQYAALYRALHDRQGR